VLVHLIADYGAGDLAFAEVQQRLALHLPGAAVVSTPVAPFDTLGTGFCIAQLALTEGPAGRVVVHNVAPRQDEPSARDANAGESFTALRLPGDVLAVGPNSGHSLSFVIAEASAAHYLDVPDAGSQFRSRDFLPQAVRRLVDGDDGVLGRPLEREEVPPVPVGVVVYVDGYGNLKTTLTEPPAPSGTRVRVSIGDVAATAIVSDGTFEVDEGDLSLAPGSSGWEGRAGHVTVHELFLRGGSAARRFGRPPTGAAIRVGRLPGG
jgi:hypothetical protein